MKIKKLLLLATSMLFISGCGVNFDRIVYPQDKEEPKITYINPSENNKEFTVGDEPYVITYDIGGRNGVTDKSVTLSSDDEDVATIAATTVEQNPYAVKITPVGAGETSVHITSVNNNNVKASIKVKVNELPADAGIISLKVPAKTELEIGESVVVEVNETNGNVVWTVEYGYDYFELSEASNASVKVTGRKAGTANVRATVNGAYATQAITVKPAPVQKTIYFIDFDNYSNVKFVATTDTVLVSNSYDEFGHKIYSFDIDGAQYESFRLSFNDSSIHTRFILCNEFVHKNAFKVNGDPLEPLDVEVINFTAPTPSVAFGAESFSIINGYSETIHVSSYLGNVAYEIVKKNPGDGDFIEITSSNNEGVTIHALAVGYVDIKAKIVGSDPEISDTIEVDVRVRPAPVVDWPENLVVDAEDTVEFGYSVTYTFGVEEVPCPVTWEIISGSEYASVSSTTNKIRITGIAEGSATLRASYDFDKTKNFTITVNPVVTKTIAFSNNKCWSEIYVYAWKGEGGNKVENASFPGLKLDTLIGYNQQLEQCFTFTYKVKLYDFVIFSNGHGEQTVDIALSNFATNDNVYPTDKVDNKWQVGFASYTPYSGETRTVYLDASTYWNIDSAKMFVHAWKTSEENCSVFMYWVSGNIFAAPIPADYTNLLFVRNSPSVTHIEWQSDGSNWWGQTSDLTSNNATPLYVLDSYNTGHWSALS